MFLIVGGDKRNLLLAKKLSENGEKVNVFGFDRINTDFFANNRIREIKNEKELKEEFEKIEKEEIEEIEESKKTKSTENKTQEKNIIVGPIPFSVDGENLYAPFNSTKISMNILKGKKFIAGKIPLDFYKETITNEKENAVEKNINKIGNINENKEKNKIDKNKSSNNIRNINENKEENLRDERNERKISFPIDIMKDENFTIANTIPTAEGAIAKAIEETEFTLDNANVMVIGYGRVGKTLCYKLKQLNANVYAVDKDEKELARAKTYGINAVNIKEININICKMDIVFNTVPSLILSKEKLILMSTETLIIDISSKPYGTDFVSAKRLGIKAIQYSGIPGKIAPDFEAEKIIEFLVQQKMTK